MSTDMYKESPIQTKISLNNKTQVKEERVCLPIDNST